MIRCTRLFGKALQCSHYVNVSSDAATYDLRTNTECTPLLPEGINKRIFKRKPADVKQRQRFLDLKKDVIQLSKSDETDKIADRFQRYILENPKSHYISLQCIQQMSIAFAAKGDVDRCRELLDLTRSILKHRHLDSIQDMNHARIVANFLFSLMNCPDEDLGRQGVMEFFEKVKERQQRYHPVILDGLSKVLINMGMVDEMKELLKLAPPSEIQSPSAVLQLADTLVSVGKLDEAARLLDSHSDFVDLSILNADHYALLAKVLTIIYGSPGYKQISRFCREHPDSIKNFTHFPVPLPKNAALCRNYEVVLHVAAKRKVYKLFRIIGGRNGLTRQLEHISCYEYVLMVQYVIQLCKYYNIPIDTSFWNHLFFNFFKSEKRGSIDYEDVRELSRTLNFYPLTSEMWSTIISYTRNYQLEDVYHDLIKVGMMDDTIYTNLISRAHKDSHLYSELLQFSDCFSIIEISLSEGS